MPVFLVKLKRKSRERNGMETGCSERDVHRAAAGPSQTVDNNILAQKERQTCEYGGVAQLGEHLPCKQGVDSSILFISTTSCAGGKTRTRENDWEQWWPADEGMPEESSRETGRPGRRTKDGHERWAHSSGG